MNELELELQAATELEGAGYILQRDVHSNTIGQRAVHVDIVAWVADDNGELDQTTSSVNQGIRTIPGATASAWPRPLECSDVDRQYGPGSSLAVCACCRMGKASVPLGTHGSGP